MNNVSIDEIKIKGRKIQKRNMLLGIIFFILMIVYATNLDLPTQVYEEDLYLFIVPTLTFLTLGILSFSLFFISLMSYTSKDDYSYLRVSDMLIIFLRFFTFIIGFAYICFSLWIMSYFEIGSIFTLLLATIIGNLIFLFILNDNFLRKIHRFIVKIFKLDDSDFNKRELKDVKVVYSLHEKRYIYCMSNESNDVISYSSNSFDSFRHGFSSSTSFLGLPITSELMKLNREAKKNIKNFGCRKIKYIIEPSIDENNNFSYVIKYYCRGKLETKTTNIKEVCIECPKK